MKLTTLATSIILTCALASSAPSIPQDDASISSPSLAFNRRALNPHLLFKRKGGGGGGGGGGGFSPSGSSSSSGGKGSSFSSSSSNTGGRTSTGSGTRSSYGSTTSGKPYYSGGATTPYRSGARTPRYAITPATIAFALLFASLYTTAPICKKSGFSSCRESENCDASSSYSSFKPANPLDFSLSWSRLVYS